MQRKSMKSFHGLGTMKRFKKFMKITLLNKLDICSRSVIFQIMQFLSSRKSQSNVLCVVNINPLHGNAYSVSVNHAQIAWISDITAKETIEVVGLSWRTLTELMNYSMITDKSVMAVFIEMSILRAGKETLNLKDGMLIQIKFSNSSTKSYIL